MGDEVRRMKFCIGYSPTDYAGRSPMTQVAEERAARPVETDCRNGTIG